MFPRDPLYEINRQRLYIDMSTHGDAKCAKAREQMRAQKIIDADILRLETRRDKLRIIFDNESASNMKACDDKLKLLKTSRQQAVIDEAANLKAFIKRRNEEIAKRELDRQMKLNCSEFRISKGQLLKKAINEDQAFVKDFNNSKIAYERDIEERMNQSGWGFLDKMCNDDTDRALVKCVREHETQDVLMKEIALKDEANHLFVKNKLAQSLETVNKMKEIKELENAEAAHNHEKRLALRQVMEDQIQDVFDRIQRKKAKDIQLDTFLSHQWPPEDMKVDRNKKMHLLNKEAHYFLEHQAQMRENRKCIDDALDERVRAITKKNREIACEREATKREFLKQLEAETHESRRHAADLKAQRQILEKEKARADYNLDCKEMDKKFARLDAREAEKAKQSKLIQEAVIFQLKDRQQRRERAAKAVLVEREGYAKADKEYLDICKITTNIGDLNLHPWRKKALGIPMDQKTS